MKFGALFKGKEKREEEKVEKAEKKERGIDDLLLETDMKLRVLYDNYKVILSRELIVAKANKRKNIKNQDNYAKIGIAYYSMLMVKRAQERMRDMIETLEEQNPQEIAEKILSYAICSCGGRIRDDMTVFVLCLWENA